MAKDEDTRTSMRYMDHLRSIALSGVRLIVEKTRTYGPSWKRRLGPGAWFTTVRPWDRLEKIVEDYGGDIFAAIEAHPMGEDGSALACVRDMRNYLLLIEAEMVARGVVMVERPEDEEEHMVMLRTSLQRLFGMGAPHHVERLVQNDTQQMTLALHFAPARHHTEYDRQMQCQETVLGSVMTEEDARRISRVPEEVVERATDAARDRAEDTEAVGARLGAGPVVGDCYTILDIGHGVGLWHVGLGAIPDAGQRTISRELANAAGVLRDGVLAVQDAGGLVASRELQGSGDLQIIIRIPCTR